LRTIRKSTDSVKRTKNESSGSKMPVTSPIEKKGRPKRRPRGGGGGGF